MQKKDKKIFRNELLRYKEKVLKELGKLESETLGKSQKDFSGDLSGYSLHMADAGTDTFDREFMLGLASNQQEFLYQIDDALRRIDEKSYGKCDNCGRAIPVKRLRALPFAKYCLKCKSQIEKAE